MILDKQGHCWYRWRSDGLEAWWRIFEEIIDAPMGRKLANAACDEEEGLLNSGELDFTGFFVRKKSLRPWNKDGGYMAGGSQKSNPQALQAQA